MHVKVQRADKRAAQINSLICNIGMHLEVLVPLDDPECGDMLWCLHVVLPYPLGREPKDNDWHTVSTYAHERSAIRAVWKWYQKRESLL